MSGWATSSTRAPGARVPRSTADQPPPETTGSGQRGTVTLGPRDRLIGLLHIDGDVRLGGTVEGEIHATGDVEIDDEAMVKASLAGGDVNIRGHVSGPVTARKRLVVARSGSLIGDVRVARLVIQDGASFSGNVSMGPQTQAVAKPPDTVDKAPDAVAKPPDAVATPEVVAKPPEAAGKSPEAVQAKAPDVRAAPSPDAKSNPATVQLKPAGAQAKPATGKGKPVPGRGKGKR